MTDALTTDQVTMLNRLIEVERTLAELVTLHTGLCSEFQVHGLARAHHIVAQVLREQRYGCTFAHEEMRRQLEKDNA